MKATPILTAQITQMIWEYPELFPNRTKALHHLFCVNGSGYEWRGGVLVDPAAESPGAFDPFEKRPAEAEAAVIKAVQEETCSIRDELLAKGTPFRDEDLEYSQEVDIARQLSRLRARQAMTDYRRDNASLLALVEKKPAYIYPLCQHSCLANVPDDVHPDYLQGARDMIFTIFQTPANATARPGEPDQAAWDFPFQSTYTRAARDHNVKFASAVLEDLSRRFGKLAPGEISNYEEYVAELERLEREILADLPARPHPNFAKIVGDLPPELLLDLGRKKIDSSDMN